MIGSIVILLLRRELFIWSGRRTNPGKGTKGGGGTTEPNVSTLLLQQYATYCSIFSQLTFIQVWPQPAQVQEERDTLQNRYSTPHIRKQNPEQAEKRGGEVLCH